MSLDGRNDANRAPKTEYGLLWDADHIAGGKWRTGELKCIIGLECRSYSLSFPL